MGHAVCITNVENGGGCYFEDRMSPPKNALAVFLLKVRAAVARERGVLFYQTQSKSSLQPCRRFGLLNKLKQFSPREGCQMKESE